MKSINFASKAVSLAISAFVQGLNAGLNDKELQKQVIEASLQNVYNVKDEDLFMAVAKSNPNYRPFSSDSNDTMLDMAVMMVATDVVTKVYEFHNSMPNESLNRDLCPSMPLVLENIWRKNDWVRSIRTKANKGSSDFSNISLEDRERMAKEELENAESGCAGGACKI